MPPDGRLKFSIVRAVDFALFLALEVHHESRLAREWTALQAAEHLFRHQARLSAEKLHLGVVLVEPHMQSSEVFLHGVAPAEEWQVQVDAYPWQHKEASS